MLLLGFYFWLCFFHPLHTFKGHQNHTAQAAASVSAFLQKTYFSIAETLPHEYLGLSIVLPGLLNCFMNCQFHFFWFISILGTPGKDAFWSQRAMGFYTWGSPKATWCFDGAFAATNFGCWESWPCCFAEKAFTTGYILRPVPPLPSWMPCSAIACIQCLYLL